MGKVRFQMFIEEYQKSALEKIQRDSNVSTAELIRNSIDSFLKVLEKKQKPSLENKPAKKLLSIVGVCKGGPKDLADKHDSYLYDISEK